MTRATFSHCLTKLNHATLAHASMQNLHSYLLRIELASPVTCYFPSCFPGFLRYDINLSRFKLKDFCKRYVSVCKFFPSHLSDDALSKDTHAVLNVNCGPKIKRSSFQDTTANSEQKQKCYKTKHLESQSQSTGHLFGSFCFVMINYNLRKFNKLISYVTFDFHYPAEKFFT